MNLSLICKYTVTTQTSFTVMTVSLYLATFKKVSFNVALILEAWKSPKLALICSVNLVTPFFKLSFKFSFLECNP